MNTHKIGVVGAGVMGRGLAHNFAQYGFAVVIVDKATEELEQIKQTITQNYRLYLLLNKNNKNLLSLDKTLDNIKFTTDYNDLADVTYLIENTTEEWETKKEVYSILDRVCPKNTIFAVNTSTIPIANIATLITNPERLIGLHFMNPVPLKKTVEVIRGAQTSLDTIKTSLELLAAIDKQGIVVNDSPGFVINRILMAMINEAIRLVEEKVATPEDIDKIFKGCLGHTMGPIETGDLIGLDTILLSLESLYKYYNKEQYQPCSLLKQKVQEGKLGNKSGQGFYTHANKL